MTSVKIISDTDRMKAITNVNKKFLDVVWLSSYDDNQTHFQENRLDIS